VQTKPGSCLNNKYNNERRRMIMNELWGREWRERLGNSREAKAFGRRKKISEDYGSEEGQMVK
jgi:hypothetical protein